MLFRTSRCIFLALLVNITHPLVLPVSAIPDLSLINGTAVDAFDKAKCQQTFPPYSRVVNPYTFCEPIINKILAGRPNEVIDLGLLPNEGKWASMRDECYFLWAPTGSRSDHAQIRRSQLKAAALLLKKQCFPLWNDPVSISWGYIDLPSWNGQSALKYSLGLGTGSSENQTDYIATE